VTEPEYRYPHSVKSLPVLRGSLRAAPSESLMQPATEQTAKAPPTGSEEKSAAPTARPGQAIELKLLQGRVIEALRAVYDPEIPINIYDLGLIYDVAIDADYNVKVTMTLTAPGCPVAGSLPAEVASRIENIPEVNSADVQLVWDPPWTRDRMSEAALLELGLL